MTRAEAAAYNEGVLAVLDIAAHTAAALRNVADFVPSACLFRPV